MQRKVSPPFRGNVITVDGTRIRYRKFMNLFLVRLRPFRSDLFKTGIYIYIVGEKK